MFLLLLGLQKRLQKRHRSVTVVSVSVEYEYCLVVGIQKNDVASKKRKKKKEQ